MSREFARTHNSTETPLTARLDDAAAPVSYMGWALGASVGVGAASWRIAKLDETTGIVVTWADGNGEFDNVWANRASLTYL